MLFYILLLLCSFLIIYRKLTKNSSYWKKRNIAHADGTLKDFILGDGSLAEVYKKVYDKFPKEPCVGIYLGTQPALLVRAIENIQAVIQSDFQSFKGRGIVTNPRDILADNILFVDNYPRWKLLRQKISPIFTTARIKNMFYVIDKCAQDFARMMIENKEMRDKPFNAINTYSTASIGASALGIDTHTTNTMDSPFLTMTWKTVNPSFFTNFKFLISSLSPTLFNILNLKIFGEFEDFFIDMIKRLLQLRRINNVKINDFIDHCIELQNSGTMYDVTTGYSIEPTNEVLAAQAFVFFIAGTDTSANVMHFTLLELSNNPLVLSKVHEEIDNIFNGCHENITYNEVEKLTYLDQVINEAMRKYPPIGALQRKCTKETVLPVGNIKVEKDVLVIVPIYAVHRDKDHFEDPEKFEPDRFSPERLLEIKKFSYIPFGEGNQICLGMRFARLQVKVGLAWLLRKFSLEGQNNIPQHFEKSSFAIRLPDAHYNLFLRKNI